MNVLPINDVHTEFHKDGGKAFVESLPSDAPSGGVDACVVAGDLGDFKSFPEALRMLSDKFPAVIYVNGNHENWGSSIQATQDASRELADSIDNLHYLEKDVLEFGGRRFVGTTMWFRPHPRVPILGEEMWDFDEIQDFVPRVHTENAMALNFLQGAVREGDIVITHHAPCWRSEDPRMREDSVSRVFYVCDMNDLIYQAQPAFWFHGHTHASHDYPLWSTRVICNPYGYQGDILNEEFSHHKIVEV